MIFLYLIHILVSIFLVLVVLLQQGKGADLSVFGGGSTQAAFGARSATSLLHKFTVWGFVAFTLTTLGIGLLQGRSSSALRGIGSEEAVTEAAATTSDAVDGAVDAATATTEEVTTEPEAADSLPASDLTAEEEGAATPEAAQAGSGT